MYALKLAAAAVAAASLFGSVAADVDPVVIKGSKFFYKTNGTQFFIRGVAYQEDAGAAGGSSTNVDYKDPLTDSDGCKRDIPHLVALRTNTIRVYAIDPTLSHDDCMSQLQDAGIYVIADLSAPNISINRADPAWDGSLYSRYTSVVDVMAKYSNTLGFFAGNEVSNNASNIDAIPYVKAAVRDTKAYIARKDYRTIGVGYAADDDPSIREPLENYLNCGDQDDAIDFFGYNIYSWCGESSFEESHYAARTVEFSNYTVPTFFAEYGCNEVNGEVVPRLFEDTISLYSKNMTGVFSGGIVFEYFQAVNKYGLVTLDGSSVSTLTDFDTLSTQIAKVSPSGVVSASYTPTNTVARSCPSSTAGGWVAATNLPPTPNQQVCSCMVQNLTCTAKTSIKVGAYDALFDVACDPANGDSICDGIASNGTTGDFGAYSMCSSSQKLAWAFNALYEQQKLHNSANTDACDFGGNATTKKPSVASSCTSLLSQAGGAAGTGTVTSAPTGTVASSGAAASSSGAAAGLRGPSGWDSGVWVMGGYVVMAAMAGVGMVLL